MRKLELLILSLFIRSMVGEEVGVNNGEMIEWMVGEEVGVIDG